MKKYLFLTNIPTPYRTSFYNELEANGLNFEVYYQREIESDRNWHVDFNKMNHRYYIDMGFYRMIKNRIHIHFNPKLIIKVLKEKNTDLIFGLSFWELDMLIFVFLKRLGVINRKFYFWSEVNYLSIGNKSNLIKKLLRRFVYSKSVGTQIRSGKMVEITFQNWGFNDLNYIDLPNTIEEEVFSITKSEELIREKNSLPIFFMPARLTEKIKGIINFFSAIGPENIKKGLFLIAGDGPDKNRIQDYIDENKLNDHIVLLGHCNTEEIVSLYKKSNVFILPSYSDQSPLTLVEAIRMRLPVLVSDRCGNHYEAVIDGENGFLFDPTSPISIKNAFEKIIKVSPSWTQMGMKSEEIYNRIFQKKMVIENFINQLETNQI